MGFEVRLHIPACQAEPYHVIEPTATRIILARSQRPIPIGLWIDSPPLTDGLMPASRRLAGTAKAVLEVVYREPRFLVSFVNEQFVQSEGTTVMITGRDKADRDTVLATWDYGEEAVVALARLNEGRKLLSLPPRVAAEYSQWSLSVALPPPAALISVVNMEHPDMALGGCGEGCPIAVGVGTKYTHLVFDHRIFDASDEQIFVERYNEALRS